ncbi:MAG: hypothetical protein ABMA00_08990 [Gemmatimonas sp.]
MMSEVKDGMSSSGKGLAELRKPFQPNQISKLPKPSKAQTEALKANFKLGQRCAMCAGWHQPDVVHLDYVGHAALTDRLLDADPMWSWEPLAFGPEGLPIIDTLGGMWIRLTVCGVTRLGYGDAGEKSGPNAIKEVIGDALRNAAMRFGAALELWHKGELHVEDKPKGVVAAVVDSLPTLSQEDREYYDQLADDVTKTFINLGAMKALERVMLEKLEVEQRVHLEQRLDSKVRSGLKQAADLKRAEKAGKRLE